MANYGKERKKNKIYMSIQIQHFFQDNINKIVNMSASIEKPCVHEGGIRPYFEQQIQDTTNHTKLASFGSPT